jgi:hypothetical protein
MVVDLNKAKFSPGVGLNMGSGYKPRMLHLALFFLGFHCNPELVLLLPMKAQQQEYPLITLA